MKMFFTNIYLLFGKQKLNVLFIIISFIILSSLEVFGIGLIIPLISKVNLSENIDTLNNIRLLPYSENILEFLNLKNFNDIISFIIIIFLIKTVLSFLLNFKINKFAFRNQRRIILELSQQYIFSFSQEIEKKETSKIIQNLMHNSDSVTLGSMIGTLRLFSELIFITIILLFLIHIKPFVTLIAIIFIALMISAFYLIFNKTVKNTGVFATLARARLIKNTQILIAANKELKIFNRLEYFFNLHRNFAKHMEVNTVIYKSLSILPRYYIEFLVMLSLLVATNLYSTMGLNSFDFLSIVGIYAVALIRLLPSVSIIISSLVQINNSLYPLEMITKDIKNKKLLKNKEILMQRRFNKLKPSQIVIENVNFYYGETKKEIFKEINFIVEPNSLLIIKGGSGSGKSSLIKLICGLYTPNKGVIHNKRINSHENTTEWFSQFAYVPQNPNFYNDTIKLNITLGISNHNDTEKLNDILKMTDLEKFIRSLPEKLETKIEEFGTNLSGGQLQRIAIARALYFDRPVIILDEPTSSLDDVTAKKIVGIINKLVNFKTIIISTHDDKFDNLLSKKIIVRNSKIYEK